ncbi:MAG: hypothetical protein WCL70_11410 [Paludibacter sp.]
MNISEAVKLLSNDINSISIECANRVTEFYTSDSDKIVSDNDFGSIVVEFEYLFLHVVDRYAHMTLSENVRDKFIEALGINVIDLNYKNYGFNIEKKLIEDAKKYEINMLNNRTHEYSNYKKMFPNQGEGTGNTLFWEFGKKITLEYLHSHNPAVIVKCVIAASDIIIKGNLEEKIKMIE